MKKKYLGLICLLYFGIIIYVCSSDLLKNFLAPQMQIYIKVSSVLLLVMALIIIFNNKFEYKFKISDLILLLPILMLILSGDARLTSSLALNRATKYNVEQKVQEDNKDEVSTIQEEIKNSEYDFSNPYFDIKDETFDTLSSYITFVEKSKKYHGQTIKLKGFALTKASYIPQGYVAIGRFSISCCAADAQFIGFILKDDNLNLSEDKWYEIEGILEPMNDKSQGIITYIKVINIKELETKLDPYVYQCFSYGDGSCKEVSSYNLEY